MALSSRLPQAAFQGLLLGWFLSLLTAWVTFWFNHKWGGTSKLGVNAPGYASEYERCGALGCTARAREGRCLGWPRGQHHRDRVGMAGAVMRTWDRMG